MFKLKEVSCPECGRPRPALSLSSSDWTCPELCIAYEEQSRSDPTTPARPGRRDPQADALRDWKNDRSLWVLVASNAATLVLAVANNWTIESILLIYWGQSVIIGLASVIRILALREFATDRFEVNGAQPPPTVKTKLSTAFFFLIHYGIFHAVYLLFLIVSPGDGEATVEVGADVAIAIAAFAISHAYSLYYNIDADRLGRPEIGAMTTLPYLRIVPMHLVILIGGAFGSSTGVLAFFMLLKTLADALMHLAAHNQLSRSGR